MSDHSSEANLHGSVKSYLTGFVLSVILTGIPFWMVMTEAFDKGPTYITIVLLAVVQIFVHLKYFLHLNFSDQGQAGYLFIHFFCSDYCDGCRVIRMDYLRLQRNDDVSRII